MKKLVIFLLVSISTPAFGQISITDSSVLHDKFIRQNLIGEWKDQNSTTIFKKNGTYSIAWDDGNAEHGKWSIERNIMAFKAEVSGFFTTYNILSFSPGKLEYQLFDKQSDSTIWIAVKIEKRK